MRNAILSGVGAAALAIAVAGCSSGGTSTVGLTSSAAGTSAQQRGVNEGGVAGGSSTAANTAAGPCAPSYVVTFCEKISITGAVTVNGTGSAVPEFDQDGALALKCATWPTYTPRNSAYPELTVPTDPVDGQKMLAVWRFPAGVGTTDISKYAFTDSINIGNAAFADVAVDVNNTTASSGSVQVNPDGSGSLTFKDLTGETGKISGTITWTCVDSK